MLKSIALLFPVHLYQDYPDEQLNDLY